MSESEDLPYALYCRKPRGIGYGTLNSADTAEYEGASYIAKRFFVVSLFVLLILSLLAEWRL